jgi:type IV secretory pathway TraG/TraD family ATPase VirD4
MANKGDEWFYLEWLAKKYGRQHDIIRLRPRAADDPAGAPLERLNVTGDSRFPFTTRARILVDTAAALNPKDERSFFKIKGAAHIGRALELLTELKRPVTPTNAYMLLTVPTELQAALNALAELDPTPRRQQLADVLEQSYLKHEAKEQRAGEVGTSQNYLEYLGTPEIAEVFSSNDPDTCSIADVDKGKILCIDVPEDYSTERKYIFTVVKLLIYRHALRRYSLPDYQRYRLNQLVYCGDEFATAITASYDGTSDYNVVDKLRDCWLTLIISSQAFESLIPPQTKEQADVLLLNLKNLVMYRAASETDALRCANALGKRWVERSTRTVHQDHTAYTYQRAEEFRIKPHEFRSLPDHTAVVRHCTNGYKKVRLRPA